MFDPGAVAKGEGRVQSIAVKINVTPDNQQTAIGQKDMAATEQVHVVVGIPGAITAGGDALFYVFALTATKEE